MTILLPEYINTDGGVISPISGTIAVTLDNVTAAITATYTPAPISSTLTETLGNVTGVITATYTPASISSSLARTLANVTGTITATYTPATITSTIAKTLANVTGTITAAYSAPGSINGTIARTLANTTATITATYTPATITSTFTPLLAPVTGIITAHYSSPPVFIPTYSTIKLYGATGTFGVKQTGLLGGKTFDVIPVLSWGTGAGVTPWFPAAGSTGQVLFPGQPFTETAAEPTADHAEVEVWDPATQTYLSVVIPTSTSSLTNLDPAFAAVGGADYEDSQIVFLHTGDEICVFTSGQPYNNWRISTGGQYPVLTVFTNVAGIWTYDAAKSKTVAQLYASNSADADANSSFPQFTNAFSETYRSGRNLTEMSAPFPHSQCIAVGHYDDYTSGGFHSGVLSVFDPNNGMAIQKSFQLPNASDSEGSGVGIHPREIQSDPSSDLNDERIVVVGDTFYTSVGTALATYDFEAGVTGWTSPSSTATLTSSTTQHHGGTKSIKLVSAVSDTMEADAPGIFAVVPGHKYQVDGYVWSDTANGGGNSAAWGLKWFDINSGFVGQDTPTPVATSTAWTHSIGTLTAPPLAVSAQAFLVVATLASGKIYYGDDVTVVANNVGDPAPYCMQEYAYNNASKTLLPKSAPVLSGTPNLRYEACCFDRYGNLYAGQVDRTTPFGTMGDTAVYLKRSDGERAYVTDEPADGTWTAGGTTTQWGIDHTPDYSVRSQALSFTPVGMFFDEARDTLFIPCEGGQLQALRVGRVGGQLQFSVPFAPIDLDLNTLADRTIHTIAATKPVYDPHRSLMHWPVGDTTISPAWVGATYTPTSNNSWLFTIDVGNLFERANIQPLQMVIGIADRRRKFLIEKSDGKRRMVLDG